MQHGYGQSPTHQVLCHATVYGPAHNGARVPVQHHGQIQPSFSGPHVGDIRGQFLGSAGVKVLLEQIGGHRLRVLRIRRNYRVPRPYGRGTLKIQAALVR